MKEKFALLVGLVVVAGLAMGAAPWRSLPACLNEKWTGITVTDPDGNLIGPEDPSDWGCVGGGTSSPSLLTPADVPVPPPPDICLLPAYPNPASPSTVLRLTLPSAAQVSLVVYGKKGKGPHGAFPVRTLISGELAAGVHAVHWDGNDDSGVRLASGIYRVVMVVGANTLCGDVEIR
jgi:hypothetical protein